MKTLRVLATLLLCSFSSIQSDGPHCFECTGVPYPRDCAKITCCGANELCSTEQIVTTSGHVVYNTGCRDKERCSSFSSELMGKRHVNITAEDTSDILTCVQCCNESFCNNKGCGTEAITLDQRGPYCYNCDSTLDPRSCTHVAVCQKNEECVLYSPLEFRGLPETVHKSHCLTKSGCEDLSKAYSNHRCPPMCCGTDFCNDHCGTVSNLSMSTHAPYTTVHHTQSVTHVQTTGTSSTTHATHTTSQHKQTTAGHTHASHSECQHGGYMHLHHELCVRVITDLRYNWTSARLQCKEEHGDLVVLDTHEKALLMREWMNRHIHTNDIFWIGGKDFNKDDTYYWVNGKPIGHDGDWTHGEPSLKYGNETQDCVSMNQDSTERFQWHDIGCQHHHKFICEH